VSFVENYYITDLQAPQGPHISFISATYTKIFIFFIPFATAVNTAFLSAQIVKPNEAFSTLHP
jgi:hypothetical protein